MAAGALAALATLAAGCSGAAAAPAAHHTAPSAPRISAAAACLDFARWWLGTDSGQRPANNLALLDKAVHEAPSGQLYQDLSAVLQVTDGLVPGNPIVAVAYQAETDCQSVNPNGG
jgi:hypothetical protein